MVQIVNAKEMYAIDHFAMNQIGIRGDMLMENAGQALASRIAASLERSSKICVLVGAGNNGGDGFVVARQLKSLGYYDVETWIIPLSEKIRDDASTHYTIYQNAGYSAFSYTEKGHDVWLDHLRRCTVIIDALLGIGMTGSLRSPYKEIIKAVNEQEAFKISIDTPSGVSADDADVDDAVKADWTMTIQCPKRSAFLYPSRMYYGRLEVCDIGIPKRAIMEAKSHDKLWSGDDVKRTMPKRTPDGHKGTYGRILIVGGSKGMTGAPVMSAKSALRCGAGLCTLAIPESIHLAVSAHVMEAMFAWQPDNRGFFSGEWTLDVTPFDAIAIGPGMGREQGCLSVLKHMMKQNVPLVIDADALYFLSHLSQQIKERKAPTIITPHAGEMARLIGKDAAYVNHYRFNVARDYATSHGVYVVLKGPFTLVATPSGHVFVNPTGNAALAKGGSGDMLTGMIVSFIVQHNDLQEALSNACFLHGKTADVLVEETHSPMDVMASDLINHLPHVLRLLVN